MTDLLMKRAASLSACGLYRWTLGRRWNESLPTIVFCGTNPSKADHEIDDPTVLRWIYFGRRWGYGGFIAVNLFPYRSSSPAECRAWWHRGENLPIMADNVRTIQDACRRAEIFVACWGNNVWSPAIAERITRVAQVVTYRPIYCFGTTKDGAPKHPLARGLHRVPDDQQPVVWRAAA